MFVDKDSTTMMSRRRAQTHDLLAVIPAFNAAPSIQDVVSKTRRKVSRVYVVDDGSTDATAATAKRAGATLIVHPSNRGKGAALHSALAYLRDEQFNYVIFLDADGQHDPLELHRLVDEARKAHADVVCGTRMANPEGMPRVRRVTNRVMSAIISWLCRVRVSDTQCGYRLLSKRAATLIELKKSNFEVETEILLQAARHGLKVTETPIRSIYGADHSSHIKPARDTIRFLRLVGWLAVARCCGHAPRHSASAKE
jgi:glycosyltransferase involved in cell wall biosynthesis